MSPISALLAPAIRLSARLPFARKLFAAFLLFALPLAAAAIFIASQGWHSVDRLREQRSGLALQLRALQLVRQAQDVYAGAIGVAVDDASIAALAAAAATRLASEAPAVIDSPLVVAAVKEKATGALAALRAEAGKAEATGYPDLREAQEVAIGDLLALREAITERARLRLVDDSAAQALGAVIDGHLPRLVASLGQARNLGYAVVVRKRLTARERADLSVERSRLQPLSAWIQEDLQKAAAAQPQLRGALEDAFSGVSDAGFGLQEYLTTKVLNSSDYDVAPRDYFERGTAAIDGALVFGEKLLPLMDAILAAEEARLQRLVGLAGAAFAALLLLLAWLYAGAYVSTLRSVKALAAAAEAMAGGDLQARAETGTRDELAQVGDSFNRMAASFRELIERVIRAAGDTGSAASSLTGQALRVTEASAGQCEKAAESASSVQQLAVSVSEVAAHAADTHQIVVQAVDLSAQGQRIAGDAIGEMQRVADDIRGAVEAVATLEARSRSVGQVVRVIAEIAGQTNLLALNAAIEAARAGEAGRGFAVVADEVRKLADRTRQSTKEIERTIGDIEAGIAEVVDCIRAGDLRVAESSRVIKSVGGALATINDEVRRSSALISEIVNATQAQSEVSQQIARSIEKMAEMAEENHDTACRTSSSVEGLNQLSQELRQAVGGLRI
jgi:methyl-accepting chemotaxis protein